MMKKLNSLSAWMLVCITMLLGACSSSEKDAAALNYLSTDNSYIIKLAPDQILKNAGFKITADGLEAPESLSALIADNDDAKKFEAALKCQGIDEKRAYAVANVKGSDIDFCCIVCIKDQDKFEAYLESLEAVNKPDIDGYSVYGNDDSDVLIKDGLAFFTGEKGQDAVDLVNALGTSAQNAPLRDWQIDKLDSDASFVVLSNAGAMFKQKEMAQYVDLIKAIGAQFIDADIETLWSVAEYKLDGNKLKGEGKNYTIDGNEVKNKLGNNSIDASMFKYLSKDDMMVLATSVLGEIDWTAIAEAVQPGITKDATAQQVLNALNGIDGTVILAGRIDDFSALSGNNGWSAKVIGKFTDEQIGAFKTMIAGLSMFGVKPNGDNAWRFSMNGTPTVDLKIDGNIVILAANTSISDNGEAPFKASAAKGQCMVFAINTPANMSIPGTSPVPFGINMMAVCDDDESETRLELEGSSEPLLLQIINYATSLK